VHPAEFLGRERVVGVRYEEEQRALRRSEIADAEDRPRMPHLGNRPGHLEYGVGIPCPMEGFGGKSIHEPALLEWPKLLSMERIVAHAPLRRVFDDVMPVDHDGPLATRLWLPEQPFTGQRRMSQPDPLLAAPEPNPVLSQDFEALTEGVRAVIPPA
jgi:hypothetical protein